MNNLVICVIAGAILCGAAVGQKDDYASCSSPKDCKSNCCFNGNFCSPPVKGTCQSQNLEKVCGNPKDKPTKNICAEIDKLSELIPKLAASENNSAVVPTLLTTVGDLVDGLLDDVGGLLPILIPLLNSIKALLGNAGINLDRILKLLNILLGTLLTGLLG